MPTASNRICLVCPKKLGSSLSRASKHLFKTVASSLRDEEINMALRDGSPKAPSTSTDKRNTPRTRALLGSRVAHLDGNFCVDCVTRDLSGKGARIRLGTLQRLPEMVYLIDNRNRRAFEARVCWRRSPEFGLHFLASYNFGDAMPPALKRLVKNQLQLFA